MAEVPYSEGVAQVSPEAAPPDDYQHIQARPEAFGAAVAQGAQELGQGVEKAGQNLFDIQAFQQKVDADDQGNHWITARDKILYGDPSKNTVGPEGKVVPDRGYFGLEGRAASDQRAATLKALEDERIAGRKNLKSPQAQLEYDSQTKRIYSDAVQRIGAHADQQWKVWAGGVNDAGANHALTHIALNADNATEVANGASDLINFRVQQAQLKYGDDPAVKATVIQQAKTEALTAQLNAVAVKDPARAMSMLEKNKNIAGTQYDELATKFRARAEQQEGIAAGDAAIAQSFAKPSVILPAAATNDAVKGAILKQESGNRSNVSTSVDGAIGPGQIIPATFRQYAKPGEDISNPEDNRKVSARIIDDYMQRYNGDATRVAVAYFSGPGNVAPAGSPAPWLRDATDGNGKSVSGYVSDVAARLGGSTPTSRKANAYQVVMTDPALQDRPAVQQHALARIRQVATDAQIAADATEKAQKEANDKAAGGYTTRMLNGDFTGIANQIANDPMLDWRTKSALHGMAEAASGDDAKGAVQSYGPKFWDLYQRVIAPAGDPVRLSDPAELYHYGGVGGGLTLNGVQKLRQVMQDSQKSVDGASIQTTKAGLMSYMKSQLSFEQDTGPVKIRDPKGEALFNSVAIPKFEAAFDKIIKSGEDPYKSFLTRESVDKLIAGMRPKSQMAMDRMVATGEAAEVPSGASQDEKTPPAPEGVDPAQWQVVMATRPITKEGKVWPMQNWALYLDSIRKDPSQENMDQFKQHFPDLDGAELIGKLGAKASAQPSLLSPVEGESLTADLVKNSEENKLPPHNPAAPIIDLLRYIAKADYDHLPKPVRDYIDSKIAPAKTEKK